MVYKEEGTALLLTQDELSAEDHHKVKYAKQNSFLAATIAVSCLCGAGIFISTENVWCYETEVLYREKDILRFYVLIGGILSALLSGRAVDFFGRRSSVIYAAVCWLLCAVFLSYSAILQTNSESPIIDVSTEFLKSHQPSELSYNLINSSGNYIHISQSLLVNINPLPTKPASIYSLSSNYINSPNVPETPHRKLYFSSSPCGHSTINSLSSRNLDVNEQPLPLLLQIITSLLLGAASTASIISASVYVFEISRADVRTQYIALSDFLCAVYGIFFPVIRFNVLILTVVACLPVVILSLLLLLPLKVPTYLSLPSSPYHLLLKSIIQKRKLLDENSAGNAASGRTGKNCVYNILNYFSYSSGKTSFSFTHVIKPHFYLPKSKAYYSHLRKNSSDSDDVSFCMNNPVKQPEQELELDKSQVTGAESQELSTNNSKICFEDEIPPQLYVSMKSVRDKEPDGLSMTDCNNSDYDDGVLTFGSTEKDHKARKALTYLYGVCKGEDEAEAIHKALLMDTDAGSQYKNESYFNIELKSITHAILKIGFPFLIIHICATTYNDVATLTGAAMSKLSIPGSNAAAAVSMLKVVFAALSMLLLDKIGHKRALMSAATVLATSSLILSMLSPYVMLNVQNQPNTATVTTLPSIPTMYPLLPTPLPQLLHRGDSNHLDNEWNDFHLFGERTLHSYGAYDFSVIWLTFISVISLIASGSMLLAPLTRVCILSAFPTCNRGSGIGILFAMQYLIHLIIFFLPCAYFSLGFTLMFRSGVCFASIILLFCFLKTENHEQRCTLQQYGFNNKFHLLFNGKICNMSLENSTVV